MFLDTFRLFQLYRISHLPYKEISIITRNTLGLYGIIVLLRDRKSTVMNIWYIKLHCKCMGQRVMNFFLAV